MGVIGLSALTAFASGRRLLHHVANLYSQSLMEFLSFFDCFFLAHVDSAHFCAISAFSKCFLTVAVRAARGSVETTSGVSAS